MFLRLNPDTYSRLEGVIQSLQLNKSVDGLAEGILNAFLDSTSSVYDEALEIKSSNSRPENPVSIIEVEDLPVRGPAASNFYLAYALKAYLGQSVSAEDLTVSDDEINRLITKFKSKYPPNH